jgi:hypothetical protein
MNAPGTDDAAIHSASGSGDSATARETVRIINQRGLHARASAKFVNAVAKLPQGVEVTVSKDGNAANGGDAGSAAVYSEDGPTITMTDSNVCRNSPRNVQPGALTHESARNVICDLCPDLDGDGTIGGADLGLVLANWGPVGALPAADLNGDSRVDGADLALILSAWGPCSN